MTTQLEPEAIPRAPGRTWQDLLDLIEQYLAGLAVRS